MTLYSAGLRFSEAAHLRIPDIDSRRMMIRVANGKGNKQRWIPPSPRLLKELRIYWLKYKPTDLLFTSAWKALKKTAETEQQYELAALMVLHT